MNFQEVMSFLYARLPMFQRVGKAALKPNLNNTLRLADHLGNPQHAFKSIHVAGTNGKGSTSHLLASILQEAGFRVGLYTSPHLKSFTERIRINGKEVPNEYITNFVNENKKVIEEVMPSFFEVTVVMAFDYFSKQKVDYAIIETGLGGRLDSTNIIIPELSVITSISLDHQDLLGDSIALIAKEKGGIIKEGIPVVVGEVPLDARMEFEKIARLKNASISFCQSSNDHNYVSDLSANVIALNLNTVLRSCEVLKINNVALIEDTIRNGIKNVISNTGLKGRWQNIGYEPRIICDVGHNEQAVMWLMNEIHRIDYKNLHIVWGMAGDKSVESVLKLLIKDAMYYFCAANVPRSMKAEELQAKASSQGLKGILCDSVEIAFETACETADPSDLIFVGGSTFVVSELKNI